MFIKHSVKKFLKFLNLNANVYHFFLSVDPSTLPVPFKTESKVQEENLISITSGKKNKQ